MLAADRHAVAARPSENPRNAVSAVGDVARGASLLASSRGAGGFKPLRHLNGGRSGRGGLHR